MRHKELEKIIFAALKRSFGTRYYAYKTHPDVYEGKGKPDIMGAALGMAIGIEVKVQPDKPSDHQKVWLKRQNDATAYGCIIGYCKTDKQIYLVPPEHIEDFSWRNRSKWLPLMKMEVGGKTIINLYPLRAAVIARVTQTIQEITEKK